MIGERKLSRTSTNSLKLLISKTLYSFSLGNVAVSTIKRSYSFNILLINLSYLLIVLVYFFIIAKINDRKISDRRRRIIPTINFKYPSITIDFDAMYFSILLFISCVLNFI